MQLGLGKPAHEPCLGLGPLRQRKFATGAIQPLPWHPQGLALGQRKSAVDQFARTGEVARQDHVIGRVVVAKHLLKYIPRRVRKPSRFVEGGDGGV